MLRIGLIGAGTNTRARHIPGLLAVSGVTLAAVCNRRPESTAAVANEFNIPRTFERWQDLVACPDIDAIVIGTWPYLHAPITLAALDAGKHVLTEARMCMNVAEAHQMLAASRTHRGLVCQIVPSPFGLSGDAFIRQLLAQGYLGEWREVSVVHRNSALADPAAPLHWRQDAAFSGVNMLTLGILHETLSRWLPQPNRVLAHTHAFIPQRGGVPVGTPDSVQALVEYPNGSRGVYQLSGVCPHGQEMAARLYGSAGVLTYDFLTDNITGTHGPLSIPADLRGGWKVEADFVASIREGKPVTRTTFEAGLDYMKFTEAVATSAAEGRAVALPFDPNGR
ncbi:MAG: gfo/Idh/MocA family oxidoreductase [Planctomycetia bacterium]|nr:gfo/Idh/MocA family oxidoreductase [Planctomycetia bacterium]